jgi:primosomal protein N' (replication factor Y) (superfamily II helicase)
MVSQTPVARVVLFKQIEQPLDYSIPDPFLGRLKAGMRVVVPVRNQKTTGIVIGFEKNPEVSRIKPIIEVLDEVSVIDQHLLQLMQWLIQHYLSGWGAAIRAVLPPGLAASPSLLYRVTDQGREAIASSVRASKAQWAILKVLDQSLSTRNKGLTAKFLSQRTGFPSTVAALQKMMKKDWVEQRVVYPPSHIRSDEAVVLPAHGLRQQSMPLPSPVEEVLIKEVGEAAITRKAKVFYLPGYVQEAAFPMIAACADIVLQRQEGVLVLVPEVAQVQSLAAHLADALQGPVGILHGELPTGIRQATWQRIASGDITIVVGTRTAVFAPFPSLGLIVVTQEADSSYKAEEFPPYHVRDVALARSRIAQVPVLLTSQMPSVETYTRCQDHQYHSLSGITINGPRASVSIMDLKTLKPGQILSQIMMEAIKKRLQMKQRVFLLLNRKGFSTALLCRDCGYVFRCSRCHVAQVLHRQIKRLVCHYCGARRDLPTACPHCKGIRLGGIGMGVEQTEEILRETFPKARVLRVDRDARLSSVKAADIFLGTEWFFRWMERPQVDLVGVLDADTYLHLPNFYAAERTFLLLAQVLTEAQSSTSGRSGREVIIQTRFPQHASIAWSRDGEAELFYKAELSEREALGYPPFVRLAAIIVRSADVDRAERAARRLGQRLRETALEKDKVQILGPAPAPLTLLRGRHRFMLLVKAPSEAMLKEVISRSSDASVNRRGSGVQVVIDVDPYQIR